MDFIVLEFINLIKRCSNGLALEKEIWQRGIELQCQAFAQALETYDAEMARQYAGKQEVLRIDRRTVLCMFGTVTFSRRLVRREGGKPFYPLDNILGLSPYQRYSPLFLYSVTKVAAGSVYRAAAEAVNTLTPLDISHQTVGRMVRTVGDKYAQHGRGGLGLRPCWYFVRVYIDSPGAGRAGPGGVGGTTSGVVAPGVEHAGDRVRLPGP